MPINRMTLFKIPKPEDQEAALAAYAKLAAENKKDGKPYILSVKGSKLYDDPRSLGYTFCAQTSFSSLDDMKYYDEQCEAHNTLKGAIRPLAAGPPMTMYMDA